MQLRADFAVKKMGEILLILLSQETQLERPNICRVTLFATAFASVKLEIHDNFHSAGVPP